MGQRVCQGSCMRKMKRDWAEILKVQQHRWQHRNNEEGNMVQAKQRSYLHLLSDTVKVLALSVH